MGVREIRRGIGGKESFDMPKSRRTAQAEALIERAAIKWADGEEYSKPWGVCVDEACAEAREQGLAVSESDRVAALAFGG